MNDKEKMNRMGEAVRRIYATKGIDFSQDEGVAIAAQLGKRPGWSAVLCGVLILALVAFLIVRFVL